MIKRREVIHPIITKWEEFSEKDKEILLKIKSLVEELLGKEVCMCVFGSRIKGTWTNDSDYDVSVEEKMTQEIVKQVREKISEVKIDLFSYINPKSFYENCIKIN